MLIRTSFLFFAILLTRTATAATYYVSPSGQNDASGTSDDPFFLIQEAIDQCGADIDSVLLAPGTYWQNVSIFDKENIVLTSEDTLNPATISGSGVEALHLIEIKDCDGIGIIHLIFREHFVQDANAIYLHGGGSGFMISNCEFFDIGWGNDPEADPESFDPIRQAHAILIHGDTIPGLQGTFIQNNYFHNIIVGNSEALTVTGNVMTFVIENNVIEDVTNIGIVAAGHYSWAFPSELDQEFNQAREGRIRRNSIRNCRRPTPGNDPAAIYVDGARSVIIDQNEVHENGVGISIGCENTGKAAKYITVANNVSYTNDKFGVAFGANAGNLENSMLRNNTLFNNGIFFDNSGGISIQKCSSVFIQDNIVYITDTGSYGISAFGYHVFNLTMFRNQLFNPEGENERVFAFNPSPDSEQILIENQPFQDPMLVSVDAENPDFHLQESSPCIDAAVQYFTPLDDELDFYGNARLMGEFVDIGAAESDFSTGVFDSQTIKQNPDLIVFPNPTSGITTIKANAAIRYIQINTLTGKRIETISGNGRKSRTFDFGSLNAGIYFLEISTEDQISTRKIIVR